MLVLLACSFFLWNLTEIKTNPVKVTEKQKPEFSSFLCSVFACGREIEEERRDDEHETASQRTREIV